jgi:hypothetical protein
MNDLFDKLEMHFFAKKDDKQKNKQDYYNHLAKMLETGEGYLSEENGDEDDIVFRKLTKSEKDGIYFMIEIFLKSQN